GRTAVWRGELSECFFQKAVHRVRPSHTGQVSRFLYYCMLSAASEGAFEEDGNRSTIVHLTAEKLRAQRFPFPPAGEQSAIADFLDAETKRIDALIKRRVQMIDLF